MFGCAWKINFPENIFSWPCALMDLTRKLVSVKIFTSNHFRTHAQREREREREREEKERSQIIPSTSPANPEPRLRHRLCRSTNPRTDLRPMSLRLCQRPKAFAPRTHEQSLSMWFWFFVWFWSTHELI